MKKLIPWLLLLAILGGCSRGMTGCAVGAVTGASVGANATGAIVFGTLIGCTVGSVSYTHLTLPTKRIV